MIDLQQCREEIDKIDKQLIELFKQRMAVSSKVAECKRQSGKPIFDKARENAILDKVEGCAENEFQKHCMRELFSQIMSMSRKLQYSLLDGYEKDRMFHQVDTYEQNETTKVVYLGPEGSYSHQASVECFGNQVTHFPAATFRDIMENVKSGKADYGILPIENSSTGGITDIYDLLVEYNNYIIGEHVLKIEQQLIGLKGTKLSDIKKVYSHQQGIRQCKKFFLAHPEMKPIEVSSTTAGASKVSKENDPSQAAIAGRLAAKQYGLEILKENINYENNNSTRFIVISNQPQYLKEANKIGICFTLPHVSGSLYNMLSHIMFNNLNMTKIESRPLEGKNFEYRFFVEFEGNLNSPAVKNTLNGIYEEAIELKILGNYIEQ